MTPKQYIAAVERLGLTVYGAGRVLGVTSRQSLRYAKGENAIPETVVKLIAAYLEHGIPDTERVWRAWPD